MALPRSLCGDPEAEARWRQGDASDILRLAGGDMYLALLAGEMYDPAFAAMEGAPKDGAKAAQWYLKAAEAGDAQACRRLTRLSIIHGTSRKRYLDGFYWFVRSQLPLLRF